MWLISVTGSIKVTIHTWWSYSTYCNTGLIVWGGIFTRVSCQWVLATLICQYWFTVEAGYEQVVITSEFESGQNISFNSKLEYEKELGHG